MGYYTDYQLSTIPDSCKELTEISIVEITGYNPFEDECKWYEEKEIVEKVSKEIPALIIIDGVGEETGDVWRRVFFDGKVVMNWKLPPIVPPEPSDDLIALVEPFRKQQEKLKKEARIKELKEELKKLEEST